MEWIWGTTGGRCNLKKPLQEPDLSAPLGLRTLLQSGKFIPGEISLCQYRCKVRAEEDQDSFL